MKDLFNVTASRTTVSWKFACKSVSSERTKKPNGRLTKNSTKTVGQDLPWIQANYTCLQILKASFTRGAHHATELLNLQVVLSRRMRFPDDLLPFPQIGAPRLKIPRDNEPTGLTVKEAKDFTTQCLVPGPG